MGRIWKSPSVRHLVVSMTDSVANLHEEEIFWRDRYHFFKQKGYVLRPRYHPEWQPSWRFDPESLPSRYEDSIFQLKDSLLDARKDGKDVFIKRVDSWNNPNEVKIASFLGSPESLEDKSNHCVPILDTFPDDKDHRYHYIVMPVFRPFNDPDFTSVGEVVDFVNQTLEGLMFIHSQHIAHRDCADRNILMDGTNIFRYGWHPMDYWRTREGGVLFQSRMRSEVEIRYYFIDFGLSTQFHPLDKNRLVTGTLGRIQAPEQKSGLPYDPFKLDIYDLGCVYQTSIVNKFKGLDVLGDLASLMMQTNPKDRPSAAETLKIWEGLRSQPSVPYRWTRLRPTEDEDYLERIMNNALEVVGMVRGSIGL